MHWIHERWLAETLYVLSVLIFMAIVRRALMIVVRWSTSRASASHVLEEGFIPLIKNLVTLFVFITGVIMILKHFNYDVMSLVTALGVGSLAVGLAAQSTISNMIAGFILIIDRNLKPGDRINLSGSVGDVEEIGLRSTRINMGNGNTLIVPNSELVNTKLLNLSMPTRETTCSMTIRVPYSVPFARVRAVCMQTLGARKGWVNLASISEGYQSVAIGFWVKDMDYAGDAMTEVNESLLARFGEEGIPLVPAAGAAAPPVN